MSIWFMKLNELNLKSKYYKTCCKYIEAAIFHSEFQAFFWWALFLILNISIIFRIERSTWTPYNISEYTQLLLIIFGVFGSLSIGGILAHKTPIWTAIVIYSLNLLINILAAFYPWSDLFWLVDSYNWTNWNRTQDVIFKAMTMLGWSIYFSFSACVYGHVLFVIEKLRRELNAEKTSDSETTDTIFTISNDNNKYEKF